MNQAIKQKYFDHGLRPLLAEDYFNVGIMMAKAMLQNGCLCLQRRIFCSKLFLKACVWILVLPNFNKVLKCWECYQPFSSCQC